MKIFKTPFLVAERSTCHHYKNWLLFLYGLAALNLRFPAGVYLERRRKAGMTNIA